MIEHLFLFFIRFHTVPMATDEDVSEPSHLQSRMIRNQIETRRLLERIEEPSRFLR